MPVLQRPWVRGVGWEPTFTANRMGLVWVWGREGKGYQELNQHLVQRGRLKGTKTETYQQIIKKEKKHDNYKSNIASYQKAGTRSLLIKLAYIQRKVILFLRKHFTIPTS